MNKLVEILKDGYEAIAQQFSLYRLLDRYQALLVEYKPNEWQSDYDVIAKIKKQIEFGAGVAEGYTDGGRLKEIEPQIDILKTSCVKLFEPTEGDGQ